MKIDTSHADGDAYLGCEIHLELGQYCARAGGTVVAGYREDSLATAGGIHDDRVGNAVRGSGSRTVCASAGAAGRMSGGATSAADHHWSGIESRGGALGIDHPNLAQLIADK